MTHSRSLLAAPAVLMVGVVMVGIVVGACSAAAQTAKPEPVVTVQGMPPVIDPANLYSETAAGKVSPALKNDLARVYVPNRRGNSVSVIDPATLQVVDTFRVGRNPQHVVPSWDLRTLWVANNAEGRTDGSLTPIDPLTGKPGAAIPVDDPYNLYWTPSGSHAIVVAEELKRLDFRDPQTMKLDYSIATPKCGGINHADFSIDGRFAFFTCEFDGAITKIDMVNRTVLATLILTPFYDQPEVVAQLATFEKKPVPVMRSQNLGTTVVATRGMPQDVRISPDGRTLFVADMMSNGVHVVDAAAFRQTGFIWTGPGAHGLYPSRDGKLLYVANRGSSRMMDRPGRPGSVSVIDFVTQKVLKTWPIPEGGSPDMGNVSADGKYLWLSGRFDDVVYRIDTGSGAVDKIKVGKEPHGLTVWPQPGRYSLGHTGNLR